MPSISPRRASIVAGAASHARVASQVGMNVNFSNEVSSLNVSKEEQEERRAKKARNDRLIPLVIFGALAVNVATGGKAKEALQSVEFGEGTLPPGVAEARALKKEKGYK